MQGGCPNRFLRVGAARSLEGLMTRVTVACVLAADGVLRQLYASSASAFASVLQPLAAACAKTLRRPFRVAAELPLPWVGKSPIRGSAGKHLASAGGPLWLRRAELYGGLGCKAVRTSACKAHHSREPW